MLAGDIMPSTSLYRIGDYSIDLAAREIRRGDVSVDVEAKVFDLIALLLDQRDRALSKREINDTLWGQRPVTDAALSQLLSKARRALGDDGESQDRPLLQFGYRCLQIRLHRRLRLRIRHMIQIIPSVGVRYVRHLVVDRITRLCAYC